MNEQWFGFVTMTDGMHYIIFSSESLAIIGVNRLTENVLFYFNTMVDEFHFLLKCLNAVCYTLLKRQYTESNLSWVASSWYFDF
jgi:hypothetical protein